MTEILLSATNLSVRFGGVLAVNNVSFDVRQGEVFTLIGPNGAGKTTLFGLCCGYLQADAGRVDVLGGPPDPVRLKGKLAAGFTVSSLPAGDKQSTLLSMFVFSMQHGMLWVGTGMMPVNHKAATRDDINNVGSSGGLMTVTPSDASTDEMVPGDIATAKAFGERLKAVVAKFA